MLTRGRRTGDVFIGVCRTADFVFAVGRGAGLRLITVLVSVTNLSFAIVPGFAKGLRFASGLDLATDLRLAIVLGLAIFLGFTTGLPFATGLDLAISLRLTGAGRVLATANRRRGLGLTPRAADLVLLADDARFMG